MFSQMLEMKEKVNETGILNGEIIESISRFIRYIPFALFISFKTIDSQFVVNVNKILSFLFFLISPFVIKPPFWNIASLCSFCIITLNLTWAFPLITKRWHPNECLNLSVEKKHIPRSAGSLLWNCSNTALILLTLWWSPKVELSQF